MIASCPLDWHSRLAFSVLVVHKANYKADVVEVLTSGPAGVRSRVRRSSVHDSAIKVVGVFWNLYHDPLQPCSCYLVFDKQDKRTPVLLVKKNFKSYCRTRDFEIRVVIKYDTYFELEEFYKRICTPQISQDLPQQSR